LSKAFQSAFFAVGRGKKVFQQSPTNFFFPFQEEPAGNKKRIENGVTRLHPDELDRGVCQALQGEEGAEEEAEAAEE
jgi:hypothetical protein